MKIDNKELRQIITALTILTNEPEEFKCEEDKKYIKECEKLLVKLKAEYKKVGK